MRAGSTSRGRHYTCLHFQWTAHCDEARSLRRRGHCCTGNRRWFRGLPEKSGCSGETAFWRLWYVLLSAIAHLYYLLTTTPGAIRPEHLYRYFQMILRDLKVDFTIAPYSACAQVRNSSSLGFNGEAHPLSLPTWKIILGSSSTPYGDLLKSFSLTLTNSSLQSTSPIQRTLAAKQETSAWRIRNLRGSVGAAAKRIWEGSRMIYSSMLACSLDPRCCRHFHP